MTPTTIDRTSTVCDLSAVGLLSLVFLLIGLGSSAWAGAIAHASGTFGEGVGHMDDDDEGTFTAITTVSNTSEYGDSYTATSNVQGPTIHIDAQASYGNNGIGALSGATGSWQDTLTLQNPDLLQTYASPNDVYLIFRPRVDGHGTNGRVIFEASIDDNGDVQADEVNVHYGPGGNSTPLVLSFQGPAASLADGIIYSMSISLSTDNTIQRGETALLDFSHTVTLPPILVADGAGNPIPALAGLIIVGSSGAQYAVTTVPEPSSAVLFICALVAAMKRRFLQKVLQGRRVVPSATAIATGCFVSSSRQAIVSSP